jgi:hypothetical protein
MVRAGRCGWGRWAGAYRLAVMPGVDHVLPDEGISLNTVVGVCRA